jgi:SAM-dependent methyltransferase
MPAVMAVLVQCAAGITLLTVFGALPVALPLWAGILLQGLLAAAYGAYLGMASWWRWIHAIFPLAVWAMFSWHLPSEWYLLGFALSVSLYWSSFKTQVPFFPSRPVVWQQVAQLLAPHQALRLIDIGSGLGDMPLHIAKSKPRCQVEGIEIAPLPWLISVLRAKIRRSGVSFKLGDYRALNFADYDVIFAYLSPAAMLALWDKAQLEMRPGSLLISLEFDIPGVQPSRCIQSEHGSTALYVWEMA